jgi:hypothetical protein
VRQGVHRLCARIEKAFQNPRHPNTCHIQQLLLAGITLDLPLWDAGNSDWFLMTSPGFLKGDWWNFIIRITDQELRDPKRKNAPKM